MAAKAGQVVSGFSKVEQAIDGGQAVGLIHASDGAADGIRKLNGRLAARTAGQFLGIQRIFPLSVP